MSTQGVRRSCKQRRHERAALAGRSTGTPHRLTAGRTGKVAAVRRKSLRRKD